jgi:hypothetical protein
MITSLGSFCRKLHLACRASSSAQSFSAATSAAVAAVAEAFAIACNPASPVLVADVEGVFVAAAIVVAETIADAAATCTSNGNAFGCAQAQAQANAWASATAEAYARAYAEAINKCPACAGSLQQATSSAEVVASSFLERVADVYARAEVQVCVAGNDNASAEAYSKCFAAAYAKASAKAVAEAIVGEGCNTANTDVFVKAATAIDFTTIESCSQTTSVTDGGSADTSGNDAEVVRSACISEVIVSSMPLLFLAAFCSATLRHKGFCVARAHVLLGMLHFNNTVLIPVQIVDDGTSH